MAMAPPTCVAIKSFEQKTCLLVRSGGSCQPLYVQKCTDEGSRWICGSADSGKGGYCPINLCNHSGQGLPLFCVHVVSCVVEGALGRAAFVASREGESVSWQKAGVEAGKKRRAKTKAKRIPCFTIAPWTATYGHFCQRPLESGQSSDLIALKVSKGNWCVLLSQPATLAQKVDQFLAGKTRFSEQRHECPFW
jgi:hypothetical protein